MKKITVLNLTILLAISIFAVSAPVLAEEGTPKGSPHQTMDEQCARDCELVLKNCAQEVDSIQDRIKKLQVQLNGKGAGSYTREELKILSRKLKENNETLRALQKPGK